MKQVWLSFIFMISAAHAYTGFGICNFGKETVSAVVCYGPAVLKDTTVTGDVKVAGPLRAANVTMGAMSITGTADIQDSTVGGLADVIGSLNANRVTFKKSLTVTSNSVVLSHTTVNGEVTISSKSSKPYLKMQCGSTITGALTFDGAEGVVQITDDSIIQGKIINGTIEFVKKSC